MRRTTAFFTLAFSALVLSAPAPTLASAPTVLVVDDDMAQCPKAGYSSIQDAVNAAPEGATVRVCPGLYREHVTIGKQVTLSGPGESLEGFDCFQQDIPEGALSPDVFTIIEPPLGDPMTAPLLRLQADGIKVSGLVAQGLKSTSVGGVYEAAIQSSDQHRGYEIKGNLIHANSLGIELGNTGVLNPVEGDFGLAAVDDNCFRENRWNLSTQREFLADTVISGNRSFNTGVTSYEIGRKATPTRGVTLRGNTSVLDGYAGIRIQNSDAALVQENAISRSGAYSIWVAGKAKELRIRGNELKGGNLGIAFVTPVPARPSPSAGARVEDNTVTGNGAGIVFSQGAEATGLLVVDNTIERNQTYGLQVQPGNSGTFRDNTLSGNRTVGVLVQSGATGSTYASNTMLGNTEWDARDESSGASPGGGAVLQNVWTGNTCDKGYPAVICQPTSP